MGLITRALGFGRARSEPQQLRPSSPFELDYALLNLSPVDAFTVRNACEGTCIFGAVGSGKTSGSGAALSRAFLSAGMGGLVLCVKPEERALWEQYARETGRSDSLVIVSPANGWRCNLLHYMLKRPGVVGSRTEQLVNLFMTILETADRGEKGQGKNDKFWDRAVRQLIRNAIDICVLAKDTVSVALLNKIIISAPRTHDEIHDENWQRESFCYQSITEADAKEKTPSQQNDFDLAATYFLREFVDFPPETRGSIAATWSVFSDVFLRGAVAELFGTETNFVPEISHNGAVIIIDLPVKQYGQAGVFVQAAFKYIWQLAAEQRDVRKNPRPCFLWIDEAHELVTDYDMQFFATARSSRVCSVLLSQNLSNYYAVLGGETGKHRAEGIFGGLGTKIFHSNGHPETNKWASSLFAKSWTTKMNFSHSNGGRQDHANAGGTESLESKVLEAEFTTLAKGGPENNYCTEAIIFSGGRTFRHTGDTMLRTIFRQRRG